MQRSVVLERLVPRALALTRSACQAGIGLTLDAEEADRLDLSLDIVEHLARDIETRHWAGLGLAVQAYGRRAPYVVDWAAALAPAGARYEFQRLHGVGQALYAAARSACPDLPAVRVYAPVGTAEQLLPYLVRRLLENGANTSFVHHFLDKRVPVEHIVDPMLPGTGSRAAAHPRTVPREPPRLYGARHNSRGADFGNPDEIAALRALIRAADRRRCHGGPLLVGGKSTAADEPVRSPASGEIIGFSRDATETEILSAMASAARAQTAWDRRPAAERAACLTRAADRLESHRGAFLALLVREAGKTIPDALQRSAKPPTSAATMRSAAASCSAARKCCPVRWASAICCGSRAAACSRASAPGTSRWPCSRARSPQP